MVLRPASGFQCAVGTSFVEFLCFKSISLQSRVARRFEFILEKIRAFVCFMLIHFNNFQAEICSAFGNQVMGHPDFIETILEILACPMDVVKPLGF